MSSLYGHVFNGGYCVFFSLHPIIQVVEFAEPMEMMGGAEAELAGLRAAFHSVEKAEEALQVRIGIAES